MELRWKRNPRPTGLMGVDCGPRGSTLRESDDEFARTAYLSARHGHKQEGWYWVARNDERGVPLENTCRSPVPDEATAKTAAMAYVKQHLAAAKEPVNG